MLSILIAEKWENSASGFFLIVIRIIIIIIDNFGKEKKEKESILFYIPFCKCNNLIPKILFINYLKSDMYNI